MEEKIIKYAKINDETSILSAIIYMILFIAFTMLYIKTIILSLGM